MNLAILLSAGLAEKQLAGTKQSRAVSPNKQQLLFQISTQ